MTHADAQELLGAYALDAVEADEAAEIESHLATCPRCSAELAGFREVTGLFAYSGQDAPAGLWDRITASMQEAPPPLRLDRIRPGLVVDPIAGLTETAAPASLDAARNRSPRQRRGSGAGRPSVRRALAVAAAVVIVALAVQVARLERGPAPHRAALTGVTMADVEAALHAPGSRRTVLTSPGAVPGSAGDRVDVVIEPDGRGYLYDARLTPLSDDRTYQLWGVADGRRISYGLLGTDPGIEEFQGGSGLRALAVTDEVASGVVSTRQPYTVEGSISPPL